MIKNFEGQVAVITGAADGLGKAIARDLATLGVQVILLDINEELLITTINNFLQAGFAAKGYTIDISNEESIREVFAEIVLKYGKIDIAINSAGIVGPTTVPIAQYEATDFDRLYMINLKGAFLITKYAVQEMEKHGYGRILLIASIAGKEGNPNMVGYSASKAGVIGLVKAVGKEYAEKGITVNGLAPAVIKTSMNTSTSENQLSYMTSKIPMNRLGTAEEVAKMASFIVSPATSFTTGFTFDISGGRATY